MGVETLKANLARVRERIALATQRAGRDTDEITLLAVTKTVSIERILHAYEIGMRDFGENYVQEAREKVGQPPLDFADIHWHFIGHLQSNKVREVVGKYALIHSVDSLNLAQEIGRRSVQAGCVTDLLLEVNLDPSGTKFGVVPDAVQSLGESVQGIAGVRFCGLMGMAPYSQHSEASRPFFQRLAKEFARLPQESRQVLSMGMTGDFEIAIEEGATLVRIGAGLFGIRP